MFDFNNARLVNDLISFFGVNSVDELETLLNENPDLLDEYKDQVQSLAKKHGSVKKTTSKPEPKPTTEPEKTE